MKQPITEKQFQEQVIDIARMTGWLVHHDRGDYRKCIGGDIGFPDLVLARNGVVIFAELKNRLGRLTGEQRAWIAALGVEASRVTAYIWRPHDLDDIARILSHA